MSEVIEIRVPDIGDFSDVPVIEVLVATGDRVKAEQSLITLESDKATMEVPAPSAGLIKELKLALNDTVSEGDVVALLEVDDQPADTSAEPADEESEPAESGVEDESASTEPQSDKQPEKPPEEPSDVSSAESAPGESGPTAASSTTLPAEPPIRGAAAVDPGSVPYASPAIRRFARELGVDLNQVKGSGSKGRIVREDVTAFVKAAMQGQPAAPAAGGVQLDLPPLPKVDFSRLRRSGDTTLIPHSETIRRSPQPQLGDHSSRHPIR